MFNLIAATHLQKVGKLAKKKKQLDLHLHLQIVEQFQNTVP